MKTIRRLINFWPGFLVLPYVAIIVFVSYRICFDSNVLSLAASIQDDSFYYIIPAFNFSHGLGFTFGGVKAYGFEPSYELLLALFGFFTNTTHQLLRVTLFLNASLFVSTGILVMIAAKELQELIYKRLNSKALILSCSLLSALVYFSNTWNYLNSSTGKENALAAFVLTTLILITSRNLRIGRPGPWIIGAVCGVLLLTRPMLSTLLYIIAVLWLLRSELAKTILGLSAVVSPWIIFALVYFGAAIPYSAQVKAAGPSNPITVHAILQAWKYLGVSLKFGVFGPGTFGVPQPIWMLGRRGQLIKWLCYGGSIFGGSGLVWLVKERVKKGGNAIRFVLSLCMAFSIGAFGMALAVLVKRPQDLYYATWYFYDSPVIVSIFFGVGISGLIGKIHPSRAIAGVALYSGIFGIVVGGTVSSMHYLKFHPYSKSEFQAKVGKLWQPTMLEAGIWFKRNIHDWRNKKVVAGSAGALNFILDDRVINLDGLANDKAARVIIDHGDFAQYIRQVKPDFIIDFGKFRPFGPGILFKRIHTLPFPAGGGYQVSRIMLKGKRP